MPRRVPRRRQCDEPREDLAVAVDEDVLPLRPGEGSDVAEVARALQSALCPTDVDRHTGELGEGADMVDVAVCEHEIGDVGRGEPDETELTRGVLSGPIRTSAPKASRPSAAAAARASEQVGELWKACVDEDDTPLTGSRTR